MRVTLRVLGLDLLDLELTTAEAEDDTARDLSGGVLTSDSIAAGPPEFMGFTNGREE